MNQHGVNQRRWPATVVTAVAGGAVVTEIVLASLARPFTALADGVVAFALAAMTVALATQRLSGNVLPVIARRRRADPMPQARGWQVWLALFLAILGWELFSLFNGPRPDHPTLSYLVDLVTVHPLGRGLTFTAWLALGGYLVTR